MVGVIEQNDPVSGEKKKYELNAKAEQQNKGVEEFSAANAGQPPPAVAQAMAAAQSAS